MGYSVNKFVNSVDPNLVCGICGGVLQNAVLTPCGHSFCCVCLDTWLDRPDITSCPECRTQMGQERAKPVHSLRNLINGFDVQCDYTEKGCKTIVKLDRLPAHLSACAYHPVECAGCGDVIPRFELAGHQIQCPGIAAEVEADFGTEWDECRQRLKANDAITNADIAELLYKISALEGQVAKFKRDIKLANAKNKLMERECFRVKEELGEHRQNALYLRQMSEYDPKYDYGHTPQSIARLSLIVATHLLQKPPYVDRERIFAAVKRCYEEYFRYNNEFEHDVHMLLATAYASNWFSASQRLSICCWLQCIARYRHDSRTNFTYERSPRSIRNIEAF